MTWIVNDAYTNISYNDLGSKRYMGKYFVE